jgi:hypothetical protein
MDQKEHTHLSALVEGLAAYVKVTVGTNDVASSDKSSEQPGERGEPDSPQHPEATGREDTGPTGSEG